MRVSVRRQSDSGAAGTPPPASATEPFSDESLLEPVTPRRPTARGIEAPMVGTFLYRAPQPGAPPFVQEGDAVAAGQTLCILEAMKLMNEIKPRRRRRRAIHVQNAEAVEFGQLLDARAAPPRRSA